MRTPIQSITNLFFAFGLLSCAAGCWVEPSSRRSPGSTTTNPGTNPDPPPSTTKEPPRIPIDTGKTLKATPGDGAGVFVTYAPGGHWEITWTCDTNATKRPCTFDVGVGSHAFTNLETSPRNVTVTNDGKSFHVHTNTTTTLDRASFDTAPGDAIVLSAFINGRAVPSLVFYVSNGKLETAPTDPIELVPTAP